MGNVKSIEKPVESLPPSELAEFRRWFAEFDAAVWDRQKDMDIIRARLKVAEAIAKAMRRRQLTQQAAAERMGVPQPKVSAMLRGDFSNLSGRKLMDCPNRLGNDIEIKVKPARNGIGRLVLAFA